MFVCVFIVEEKEGDKDFAFCQSLVIAFVTPPTPRVVDSAAFVTSTVSTQFWKKRLTTFLNGLCVMDEPGIL